jgi:hypothetical protein
MGRLVLRKAIEILIGIGGAVLFDKLWQDAPHGMAFVVAILLFIVCELIISALDSKEYHDSLWQALTKLADRTADANGDWALVQLRLAYAGRNISRPETSDVWNQLTWAARRSYRATNYIDIGDLYENNYAEDVIAVQKAKVRALKNFTIKKVFIADSDAELKTSTGARMIAMHCDEKAPMEIRTIRLEQIEITELKAVGGRKRMDFALFDDQVVLVWHLDEQRKIGGSEVIVGDEQIKKFRAFFDHVFTAGARSRP